MQSSPQARTSCLGVPLECLGGLGKLPPGPGGFQVRFAHARIRGPSRYLVRFDGPGAEGELDGAYHVDGTEHADHQIRVDNVAGRGTSRR